MKKFLKKIIPFWAVPAHWGLEGDLLERAKIHWNENDEYEKNRKLLELELKNFPDKLKLKLLELDYNFGKIDSETYEIQTIEMNSSLTKEEKSRKLLELNYRHGKMSKDEYEKEIANIEKRPWVKVIGENLNSNDSNVSLEMELDWNSYFIEELKKRGYRGRNDTEIVDQWLHDLFKTTLLEAGYFEFDENYDGSLVHRRVLENDIEEYE
jgi:hypothetical protein